MGKEIRSIFNDKGEYFVESSIGVKIKILEVGWKLISEIKHLDLKGRLDEVIEAIQQPDIILISDQSDEIFLYHKRINSRYIRVVCRHYNSEGFLITAHYIKEPKGGREYVKT